MILYDAKAMAVSNYSERLPVLLATERLATSVGDLGAAFWTSVYRDVVRRAMEAELADPEPPARPIGHCFQCTMARGRSAS